MVDARTQLEALTLAVVALSCALGIVVAVHSFWLRRRLDALGQQIAVIGRGHIGPGSEQTRADAGAVEEALEQDKGRQVG